MTADSRILVGELSSYDTQTNLVSRPVSNNNALLPSYSFRLGRITDWSMVVAEQVLLKAVERVIRSQDDDEPSSEVPMGGLYIVRGDNVCTVGLVVEDLDNSIDWTKVKGEAIGGIKHI
ncbi:hypothetical protein PG993_004286 [Apiospora rasikravindrae]|uniref:U6 snRNA-associated Sm-like protein LSm8 n=1 Tax=Apiospora rasikravindrae TaxID=990691 RepID=A0ABR1TCD2_9PEZI